MAHKNRLDYKWVILGACFLMTFVCLGFCSGNKALYLTAITDALGIKRSLFSVNDSCRYIATSFVNIFFGSLLFRFGIRKLTAFGFATLIASTLLYAYAENIFVFYIGGFLLGIGLTFTTTSMASSVVRRWFRHDVGRYTGIVLAANGVGGAVAAQIVTPLIKQPGNPFGYRTSYLVVAAILLVTGIIAVALLRERPMDEPVVLNKRNNAKAQPSMWKGIDFQTAKKSPVFFLTAALVLLTGFILQGISGVYVAHMEDVGLNAGTVATVVSVYSLMMTVSKIAVGVLYDRFGLKLILPMCQLSTVVAFVFLAFLQPTAFSGVFAMAFAVLYAIALPLETLVIPLIAHDLFGNASYDKVLGVLLSMNYIGYALGAPVVNLGYDCFGSYKPVLLMFSAMMLVACIGYSFVLRFALREKERLSVS